MGMQLDSWVESKRTASEGFGLQGIVVRAKVAPAAGDKGLCSMRRLIWSRSSGLFENRGRSMHDPQGLQSSAEGIATAASEHKGGEIPAEQRSPSKDSSTLQCPSSPWHKTFEACPRQSRAKTIVNTRILRVLPAGLFLSLYIDLYLREPILVDSLKKRPLKSRCLKISFRIAGDHPM